MNYYKATVQYDGTNYCGFQWQKDIPTVQDDINQTLALFLSGKITTVGASRTDSGVHAVEQIVKITTDQQIECESFIFQLNKSLPQAIRCLNLVPCAGDFNPITGTKVKEYRYLFTNDLQMMAADQKYIANNPYKINVELMKKCAREIVGTHDFRNFCSTGSNVKTTIRDITFCEISEVDPHTVLPKNELF
jgi:tRNA pseudouridine38-40 synthase